MKICWIEILAGSSSLDRGSQFKDSHRFTYLKYLKLGLSDIFLGKKIAQIAPLDLPFQMYVFNFFLICSFFPKKSSPESNLNPNY
jgi:hypothetical protein